MLTKPEHMALRALYSFSNHAGWDDVSKFLEGELNATYRALATAADEVTLRQMQGRARFIQEFTSLVRDAAKQLEKLRETTL